MMTNRYEVVQREHDHPEFRYYIHDNQLDTYFPVYNQSTADACVVILNKCVPAFPDTIDWDQVADEFICMARDKSGFPGLYREEPVLDKWRGCWLGEDDEETRLDARVFSSFCLGERDWTDSLVRRPDNV